MEMGGPEMAPHTPNVRERPGNAVALLYIPVLLYSGSLSDSADRAISSVQDRKYRKYPSCPAWAWLAAPAD